MEPSWAADHLQVIRTLMERSAIYRRALAPIMIYVGVLGLAAGVAGWVLRIGSPAGFVLFWNSVGVVAVAGAFLMVRRQAFQQAEPLWSPPTRRVAQAMLPPLTAGFIMGVVMALAHDQIAQQRHSIASPDWYVLAALPCLWVLLYGCAIHAAGFFMRRGIRLLGWGFILLAWTPLFCPASGERLLHLGHASMGLFFGLVHLAYGVYLYFTEPRGNET